jgi:hypothetical protein
LRIGSSKGIDVLKVLADHLRSVCFEGVQKWIVPVCNDY